VKAAREVFRTLLKTQPESECRMYVLNSNYFTWPIIVSKFCTPHRSHLTNAPRAVFSWYNLLEPAVHHITKKTMMSYQLLLYCALILLSLFATHRAQEVGDSVCVEGYVMDNYCIERGTLFDNPTVNTLENPGVHSVHCLVDVPQCIASPYEILTDPPAGESLYVRGYQLNEETKQQVLQLAYSIGSCSTSCTGDLLTGLRVGMVATIVEAGTDTTPPVISATSEITYSAPEDMYCPQPVAGNQQDNGAGTTTTPPGTTTTPPESTAPDSTSPDSTSSSANSGASSTSDSGESAPSTGETATSPAASSASRNRGGVVVGALAAAAWMSFAMAFT